MHMIINGSINLPVNGDISASDSQAFLGTDSQRWITPNFSDLRLIIIGWVQSEEGGYRNSLPLLYQGKCVSAKSSSMGC